MKVLVTFAVLSEFAPWRSRHKFLPVQQPAAQPVTQPVKQPTQPSAQRSVQRRPAAGADAVFTYQARVANCDVRVVLTGMGGQNAALRLHRAFREAPDFCISSGLAGGLTEACRAGDVVVGRRVSWRGTTSSLPGDAQLLRTASACGAKLVNRFVTVEKIAVTAAQKQSLGSSGDVVEMESYFVMRAAAGAKVPAVAVRAISDVRDEDLPMDFDGVVDAQGSIKMRKLLGRVAQSPRSIPALMRFGLQSRKASRALADFLDLYLNALDGDGEDAASLALREATAV
ncbi:MAG: hypothetical protein GZ088_13420 [Acidipila sp.]|nr:hypothetical protein [Acidipila sp.]